MKQSHIIRNQLGRILGGTEQDQPIIDEINYTLERDLTFTYFQGTKITIHSSKVIDNERTTIVEVEGIV